MATEKPILPAKILAKIQAYKKKIKIPMKDIHLPSLDRAVIRGY